MSRFKPFRLTIYATLCALAACFASLSNAVPFYSVTDLGPFGIVNLAVSGINNAGQVVGWANVATGYRGFLNDGASHDPGTLGGIYSKATGINDSALIVGFSTPPGNAAFHAFLYSNGSMQDLGTLGGPSSYAYGINATSQIVGGSAVTGDAEVHPFLYPNGS